MGYIDAKESSARRPTRGFSQWLQGNAKGAPPWGPRGESLRGSTAPSQFRMAAKPNTRPPVALRLPPGWPGQGWLVSPTHGVSPCDYVLLRSIIQLNCFPARLLISIHQISFLQWPETRHPPTKQVTNISEQAYKQIPPDLLFFNLFTF